MNILSDYICQILLFVFIINWLHIPFRNTKNKNVIRSFAVGRFISGFVLVAAMSPTESVVLNILFGIVCGGISCFAFMSPEMWKLPGRWNWGNGDTNLEKMLEDFFGYEKYREVDEELDKMREK